MFIVYCLLFVIAIEIVIVIEIAILNEVEGLGAISCYPLYLLWRTPPQKDAASIRARGLIFKINSIQNKIYLEKKSTEKVIIRF